MTGRSVRTPSLPIYSYIADKAATLFWYLLVPWRNGPNDIDHCLAPGVVLSQLKY